MTTIQIGSSTEVLDPAMTQYKDSFSDCASVFKEVVDIMHAPEFEEMEGWKPDFSNETTQIFYKDLKNGRYFLGKTKVPLTVPECVQMTWDGISSACDWNDSFKFCDRYKKLSENCDIAHYGTNKKLIIDGREFVCSRALHTFPDGEAIIAAKSTKVKEIKEAYGVRAHLYICGARFRPDPSCPLSCLYEYIICMDLKGYMLKSVTNPVLGRLIHEEVDNVRKQGEKLRTQKQ